MRSVLLLFIFSSFCFVNTIHSAYVLRNGKLVNTQDLAYLSLEEHFSEGMKALEQKNWNEAKLHFRIIIANFPKTTQGYESFYFLGVVYYNLSDMDFANQYFTHYLYIETKPKYIEETFRYKFAIANAFKNGARRHLMGYESMPTWLTGKSLAIKLYDEVVRAFPQSEIAAESLLAKVSLLREKQEFSQAAATLEEIIRKFPKSQFASTAYSQLSTLYIFQAKREMHNPDLLQLSALTLRKFSQDFPNEAKLIDAKKNQQLLQEIFAEHLYDTASLYERKKEFRAAYLYYYEIVKAYPNTKWTASAQKKLQRLSSYGKDLSLQ